MANLERGEVEVRLLGESQQRTTLTLRPTWQAIVKIEQATGRGIMPLAREVVAGEPSFGTCLAILHAGSAAAGREISRSTLGELLERTGLTDVENLLKPLATFCANAITGQRNSVGDGASNSGKPVSPTGQSDIPSGVMQQ